MSRNTVQARRGRDAEAVDVREPAGTETSAAAALLGRGMRDNPQENLPFYERFGFRVTEEDNVVGVRNRFMERPAGS